MGRSTEITYEDISGVCAELAAEGKRPTYAAIKERFGGSYSVIKRYLEQWQQEAQAGARFAIPANLATELGLWYQKASAQAKAEAQIWLEREQTVFLVKEQNWLKDLDAMKLGLAKAVENTAQMGHDLSIQTLKAAHAAQRLDEILAININLLQQVKASQSIVGELQASLLAEKSEQTAEKQRFAHELELAQERVRGTEKALLMRHHAEVELQKVKTQSAEKQLVDLKLRYSMLEQHLNARQPKSS
jgi:Plasmid replication region DNA-binding N-term